MLREKGVEFKRNLLNSRGGGFQLRTTTGIIRDHDGTDDHIATVKQGYIV